MPDSALENLVDPRTGIIRRLRIVRPLQRYPRVWLAFARASEVKRLGALSEPRSGGGINPVALSTSCSSSCFGCTSCSCSGSGLVTDPDPVLTSILGGYVAVIPVEAQIVAQRLLEDPGALSQ